MLALLIAVMLLYVGLVVAPQKFGLRPAPPQDWFAALTGILAGSALYEMMSSILDQSRAV